MQETPVPSLGWEDPLEEELAAALQYSCLEHPMDERNLWATVHAVPKSQTQPSKQAHATKPRKQASKCTRVR